MIEEFTLERVWPNGRYRVRSLLRREAGQVLKAFCRFAVAAYKNSAKWLYTLLFLPTVVACIYFGVIAADLYKSEAQFITRNITRTENLSNLTSLLQIGLGRSQDDSFAVSEFISSRDAVRQLRDLAPIDAIYAPLRGDPLATYPSIFFGRTEEELYAYLRHMISVGYNSSTGITTLKVRAFRAGDANLVASALLTLSERLINRMNERMQADAISSSLSELNLAQERLIDAQIAITTFRNRELIIDPAKSAVSLSELISTLSADLAQAHAQMSEMLAASPSNPQLPGLRRRIAALEAQIGQERARITSSSDGLAEKMAEYDRVTLRRDFANRALAAAEAEVTRSRAEARRQQLYLIRIAGPSVPDYAAKPHRTSIILTTFGLNLIAMMIGWLIYTGIREHAAGRR